MTVDENGNGKSRPGRSRGAIMLASVGQTNEAMASMAMLDQSLISRYQTGGRRPGPANRALFRRLWEIPEEAWDEPATAPRSAEPRPPPPAEGWTVLSRATRLRAILDRSIDQVESDPTLTALERSRLTRQAAGMLVELGKLTGETTEVDERKIMRLPAWRRIEDVIAESLKPWPEAMATLARALDELAE